MSTNFDLLSCHSFTIPGIPDGIYSGQHENLDTINDAMYQRNIADIPLKPNMNYRSVPTRNTLYPVLDQRTAFRRQCSRQASLAPDTVTQDHQAKPGRLGLHYLDHSADSNFAAIQTNGPPSGFQVNQESQLRNQYFALQHGAGQGIYVPSSGSDLYRVQVPSHSHPDPQPFHNLFSVPRMTTAPPPMENRIGQEIFNNNTKTQLRNTVSMW